MADGIEFNVDNIMSKLDLTQQKMNHGANKALKESAKPLKEEIEKNTNRSSSMHRKGEGHAADDVTITGIKGGASDNKHVDVGYAHTGWRMWFVEFGTYTKGSPKGIAPQNIVRKSISARKDEVKQKQIEVLRGELGT